MDVNDRIKEQLDNNPILVYIKGTPDFPQCGFSMRAVNIVNALGVPFETVDVLADMEIRQGIKEFSAWPTIPQLYIDGQFVGGSDICWELYQNGELEKLVADHPRVETD